MIDYLLVTAIVVVYFASTVTALRSPSASRLQGNQHHQQLQQQQGRQLPTSTYFPNFIHAFNLRLQATSSSKLQSEKRKKITKSTNETLFSISGSTTRYSDDSVVRRLKRATVRASTEAATVANTTTTPKNHIYRDRTSTTAVHRRPGTLFDLVQLIDHELEQNRLQHHHHLYFRRGGDGGSGSTAMMIAPQPDSMEAILTHNSKQEEDDDKVILGKKVNAASAASQFKREVAVLLTKSLHNDDITLEGAGRVRLLVKMMLEKEYRPDLICFVGGTCNNNHLSSSDASYLFFRHLMSSQQSQSKQTQQSGSVSEGMPNIVLIRHSIDQDALGKVIQHIHQNCLTEWKQGQQSTLAAKDSNPNVNSGIKNGHDSPDPRVPRQRIHLHFSLISSDYALCQLHDIHTRSPNQSVLRALQNSHLLPPNAVKTTWTYHYLYYTSTLTSASSNNLYTIDPVRSFAAKTYKMAQRFVPVLKNIRAVLDHQEFFQRDNYRVLVAARRSLVRDMENKLHRSVQQPQMSLRPVRRHHHDLHVTEEEKLQQKPLDVVLEGALLGLGRCLDLVRPAGLLTGSVARDDFRRALNSLQQAYYLLDRACDTDEPLHPDEWGKLNQDHFVHQQRDQISMEE